MACSSIDVSSSSSSSEFSSSPALVSASSIVTATPITSAASSPAAVTATPTPRAPSHPSSRLPTSIPLFTLSLSVPLSLSSPSTSLTPTPTPFSSPLPSPAKLPSSSDDRTDRPLLLPIIGVILPSATALLVPATTGAYTNNTSRMKPAVAPRTTPTSAPVDSFGRWGRGGGVEVGVDEDEVFEVCVMVLSVEGGLVLGFGAARLLSGKGSVEAGLDDGTGPEGSVVLVLFCATAARARLRRRKSVARCGAARGIVRNRWMSARTVGAVGYLLSRVFDFLGFWDCYAPMLGQAHGSGVAGMRGVLFVRWRWDGRCGRDGVHEGL
ncbi:hypothetical protein EJ06DRAFT_79753 [Trichodelitschia bisporula]|uniref:Uncharacterized protein n=1 Tax=Trichodelitschia bisporula TaxID=703511 RepID=A0A6G1HTP6_9PEZI|nr:hypothetical protein EJ06DRAFT_79753 [Trichodelitschia bisporula]